MFNKHDVGQYFIDEEGMYWKAIGYINEPTIVFRKIGTMETFSGAISAPNTLNNFKKIDVPVETLDQIFKQIEDNK